MSQDTVFNQEVAAKQQPEVAAEAATVNNTVAADAVTEEPTDGGTPPPEVEAAKQRTLLEEALDTSKGARAVQCSLFGRHFSSTTKMEVVKQGAEAFLKQLNTYKANLEALLKEIAEKEAKDRLMAVIGGAENLSGGEIQKMIQALNEMAAKKTA